MFLIFSLKRSCMLLSYTLFHPLLVDIKGKKKQIKSPGKSNRSKIQFYSSATTYLVRHPPSKVLLSLCLSVHFFSLSLSLSLSVSPLGGFNQTKQIFLLNKVNRKCQNNEQEIDSYLVFDLVSSKKDWIWMSFEANTTTVFSIFLDSTFYYLKEFLRAIPGLFFFIFVFSIQLRVNVQ